MHFLYTRRNKGNYFLATLNIVYFACRVGIFPSSFDWLMEMFKDAKSKHTVVVSSHRSSRTVVCGCDLAFVKKHQEPNQPTVLPSKNPLGPANIKTPPSSEGNRKDNPLKPSSQGHKRTAASAFFTLADCTPSPAKKITPSAVEPIEPIVIAPVDVDCTAGNGIGSLKGAGREVQRLLPVEESECPEIKTDTAMEMNIPQPATKEQVLKMITQQSEDQMTSIVSLVSDDSDSESSSDDVVVTPSVKSELMSSPEQWQMS
jgi:hypothetical protein